MARDFYIKLVRNTSYRLGSIQRAIVEELQDAPGRVLRYQELRARLQARLRHQHLRELRDAIRRLAARKIVAVSPSPVFPQPQDRQIEVVARSEPGGREPRNYMVFCSESRSWRSLGRMSRYMLMDLIEELLDRVGLPAELAIRPAGGKARYVLRIWEA